jgi:hypothetical protein
MNSKEFSRLSGFGIGIAYYVLPPREQGGRNKIKNSGGYNEKKNIK